MQVHNTGAAQTVFAFNNWGNTGTPTARIVDIGIGNDPAPVNDGRDWTFHNNAGSYTVRSLQVLVRTTGDHTAPAVSSALAAAGRTQVVVNFSEPLASASVSATDFSLNNGVTVLSATLSADRRTVIFAVADTGIGIAPEDQARIFDEFTQVPHALQSRVKGTGLGLPLCQRLARLLGGEISLVSQPQVGSTFTLKLPRNSAVVRHDAR
jgi:signal transduction histidine kinase